MVPKVAAINDLSGLGKCSLTAAIPVLAAMGVQACPLPTAALSNQTGFPSYACADLSDQMEAFADEWQKRGVRFEGVYTGYLCGPGQAAFAARFLDRFAGPETVVLVDPVLGDNGRLYPMFDGEMRDAVGALARKARVITPNLTEACLLAGGDYAALRAAPTLEPVWALAERLAALGPETVVITGVHRGADILNLGFDAREGRRFTAATRRRNGGFSGTGDLLASALCGGLVRGDPAPKALGRACALLGAAIAETVADGTDPNEGVAFEHHLHLLWEE